jgi:hypothetical protein
MGNPVWSNCTWMVAAASPTMAYRILQVIPSSSHTFNHAHSERRLESNTQQKIQHA